MRKSRFLVQLGVALTVFLVLLAPAQANPDPVTITKHANLGFSTSVPVDADTGVGSPPCLLEVGFCLFRGAVAFHGTLTDLRTLVRESQPLRRYLPR